MKVYVENADPLISRMFVLEFGAQIVKDYQSGVDLVVFSGGTDVDPTYYGEPNRFSDEPDVERDSACYHLFKWCEANDVPMIGICRGSQFLNVMNGGSLWQDVDNHCGNHYVYTDMGMVYEVTSTHHQMMIPGLGARLVAWAHESRNRKSARSVEANFSQPDPEVLYYEATRSLCFQPHPEYGGYDETLYFFKECMESFGYGKSS